MSILNNVVFTNIRRALNKKHWRKVIAENYNQQFLRECISLY